MEGDDPFDDDFLHCSEKLSDFLRKEDLVDESSIEELLNERFNAQYNEADMRRLFDQERRNGFNQNEALVLSNWLKAARLEAITLILDASATLGFGFQTAYLSLIYLDRFLSRRRVEKEELWAAPLLSRACVLLAAKMEETEIPALPTFQAQDLHRMETLVLTTLGWRLNTLTPFIFLHFFITKWCKDSPSSYLPKTVEIVLAVTREINLAEHRPSVIAAAATLRALDQRLTRNSLECKINSISYCGFHEVDDVFTCYSVMQTLDIGKLNIPEFVNSPSTHLGAVNGSGESSTSAATGTKRRRPTSSSEDDDIPD